MLVLVVVFVFSKTSVFPLPASLLCLRSVMTTDAQRPKMWTSDVLWCFSLWTLPAFDLVYFLFLSLYFSFPLILYSSCLVFSELQKNIEWLSWKITVLISCRWLCKSFYKLLWQVKTSRVDQQQMSDLVPPLFLLVFFLFLSFYLSFRSIPYSSCLVFSELQKKYIEWLSWDYSSDIM